MIRCHRHDLELEERELWEHILNDHLYRLEQLVSEQQSDQQRLDADVIALQAAIKAEVDALKSKVSDSPQAPVASLDFSGLESLVSSVQATVPPAAPAPIMSDDPELGSAPPTPSTIGGLAASPFVDTDNDEVNGVDADADADNQAPALSSEATTAPATDAQSVTSPDNEITPTTENSPSESA